VRAQQGQLAREDPKSQMQALGMGRSHREQIMGRLLFVTITELIDLEEASVSSLQELFVIMMLLLVTAFLNAQRPVCKELVSTFL
jgi:hypothetical protein